jgi:hypothetical protein
MVSLERGLPSSLLRWECAAACVVFWAAFVSIPLSAGELGLSWDALNHHIYLGWTAQQPRLERDFVAAGYQSYQFPYLYWPVYKLALGGWSGAWAGAVLATLQVLAVPPVWMLARTCMPGATVFDVLMRLLAVALAFMTGVVLSIFDSTSNDLMAAIPLVWALALALRPLGDPKPAPARLHRLAMLSGACAGVAVAFKLSNGPLAVLFPALWAMHGSNVRARVYNVALGSLAAMVGYVLVYGYWGALLWHYFGNPIYPFYDGWFEPLRTRFGWTP